MKEVQQKKIKERVAFYREINDKVIYLIGALSEEEIQDYQKNPNSISLLEEDRKDTLERIVKELTIDVERRNHSVQGT